MAKARGGAVSKKITPKQAVPLTAGAATATAGTTTTVSGARAARTGSTVNDAVPRGGGFGALFRRYQPWLSLLVRLGLAVVWIWASVPKLTDPAAAAQEIKNYNIFPTGMATSLGHIQPYVELALGLLVLVGLGTRLVGAISGILFLAFIGGIISLWARGIFINCGCFSTANTHFGSATQAGYPAEIARDVGFLLLAAWLVVWPRSRFSLDRTLLGS